MESGTLEKEDGAKLTRPSEQNSRESGVMANPGTSLTTGSPGREIDKFLKNHLETKQQLNFSTT